MVERPTNSDQEPKIPRSKIEVRGLRDGTETFWLDGRYGTQSPFGNVRGPYRRETAEEMARLDDLVEDAGVKPGDRFELKIKKWRWNSASNQSEVKEEVWESFPGVVFRAIENGRFLVKSIVSGQLGEREWALELPDHGRIFEDTVEIRKVTP